MTAWVERRASRVMTAVEADALIGRTVSRRTPTVAEPTVIYDQTDGQPLVAYLPFPGDLERFREAVRAVGMSTTMRGAGLRNLSRTFGFSTRSPILKRDGCHSSSLYREQPAEHTVLVETAAELDALIGEYAPERRAVDRETMTQVHPDWRLGNGETNWTSGVINHSSALPYHRDRANFPTLTAMPVVRRGARGGYLHIPEYDLTLACRDGSVTIFDGKTIVHGVTPIDTSVKGSYRFSIPYYSQRGMRDCFSEALEQRRSWEVRTRREAGALDTPEEIRQRMPGRGRPTGYPKLVRR